MKPRISCHTASAYSLIFAALAAGTIFPARAQNDTWTGNAGSSNAYWDVATNWNAGLPTSVSGVVIGAAFDPTFRPNSGSVSIFNLQDSGGLTVTGGSLNTASASFISGKLSMSGGSLGGTGALTVGGAAALTGGVVGTSADGIVDLNGSLALSGQAEKDFGGGTVNTYGTTTWSGNTSANGNFIRLGAYTSATVNNFGTWLDENTFAAQIGQYNGSQFNNVGTYTKSGNSVTTFNTVFNNTGAVNVEAGTLSLADGGVDTGKFTESSGATLQLSGGTHQLQGITVGGSGIFQVAAGSALQSGVTSDAGQLNIIGGDLEVQGSWTAASYLMSGGILGGAGTTTITGAANWSGGYIGDYVLGIDNFKSSLTITGQAEKDFGGGTVNTYGTTTWSGNTSANGNFIRLGAYTSATVNNFGTWLDENTFAAQIGQYNGSQFNNVGTYTKSGNSVTTFNTVFNNTGAVNVEVGTLSLADGGVDTGKFTESSGATLQLSGGTHQLQGITVGGSGIFQVAAGSALQSGVTSDAGQLNIIGGDLEVQGSWTAASYLMSGGILGGVGTTTITGAANWSGGYIGDNALGIDNFKSSLTITGQAEKDFGGGTVNTYGTTTWSGNTSANGNFIRLGAYQSATVNNFGTWLDENTFAAQIGQYNGSQFNNVGTYTKSGNSVTTFNTVFNNTGAVNVEAGTLSLADGGVDTGKFTESSGATLQLSGGTHQLQGITVGGSGIFQVAAGSALQSGVTSDAGQLNIIGGDLEVQGSWTAASYLMSGGILGGAGTTTITGAANWSGGYIGDYVLGIDNFKSSLTITGQAEKDFGGGTVNTYGTTTWSGNTSANGNFIRLGAYTSATVNNFGTWLDENTFAAQIGQYNGSQFNNVGTYTKSGNSVTTFNTGFSNPGVLNVNAGTLNLNGGLANFVVTSLTSGTYNIGSTLEFPGANIVTNDANITLKGSASQFLNTSNGNSALANFAVNAASGSFSIGSGINFVTAGSFSNFGSLDVGGGSTFTTGMLRNFSGTTLTGGTYVVDGTLKFAGANIITDSAGISLVGAASQIVNSTTGSDGIANLATVTSGGSFGISGGRNFTTVGKFTNNGTLNVGSGSTFATATLANLSGTTLSSGIYNVSGTLNVSGANIVTNGAAISLSGTSSAILNATTGGNALANLAANTSSGSLNIAGGRTFTTAGNFINAGSFSIGSGSTFTVASSGSFTQSAGTTTDNGTLVAAKGLTLSAGTLLGSGSIVGGIQSSGIVAPGASLTSTGVLTDTGAYTQNAAGTLDISIGGTTAGAGYDEMNVTTGKLGGTLNVKLIAGYVPAVGSTFKILNYSSESGQFSTINGLAINGSEHFAVSYQGTDVLMTVVNGALPASTRGHPVNAPSGMLANTLNAGALFQSPRQVHLLRSDALASSRAAVDARPRLPGKMRSANVQLAFGSLFSRPRFSLGLN